MNTPEASETYLERGTDLSAVDLVSDAFCNCGATTACAKLLGEILGNIIDRISHDDLDTLKLTGCDRRIAAVDHPRCMPLNAIEENAPIAS